MSACKYIAIVEIERTDWRGRVGYRARHQSPPMHDPEWAKSVAMSLALRSGGGDPALPNGSSRCVAVIRNCDESEPRRARERRRIEVAAANDNSSRARRRVTP
ncbi:hypothetical protein [Gemmatimonas sp.]|uniref:hypothetical protein n=1 Tax=Gemmatimonas sp. TaxID=1962908 RepID=UPI00398304B4